MARRALVGGEIFVGMSDDGLEPLRVPSGCDDCTPRLRRALLEVNRTQAATSLRRLACERCGQAG